MKTQGGSLDVADRLFASIAETWDMCISSMSEVKELTPEFYSLPDFLRNVNGIEMGTRQDGSVVNDVELPPWASSPEEFVRKHRSALESEYVSAHLHEWLDLIFGYKQRGQQALESHNVFYYLTYYGVVDLDSIEDPALREATELQIAHFGQCPKQLWTKPHPPRGNLFVKTTISDSFPHAQSLEAQQRRQWEPLCVQAQETPLQTVHVLSEHMSTVNSQGVVQLLKWQIVPQNPNEPPNRISVVGIERKDTLEVEGFVDAEDENIPKHPHSWQLNIHKEEMSFESVPCLPLLKDCELGPVASSETGSVIWNRGGARGEVLYATLVNLENGHLVTSVGLYGHSDAITCLHRDRLANDEGELWVAGSKDTIITVWKLSNLDRVLKGPQVSRQPVFILRGHPSSIIAVHVKSALGLVASSSESTVLVHSLPSQHVLFSFSMSSVHCLALSLDGYLIALANKTINGSIVRITSLSGYLVHQQDHTVRHHHLLLDRPGKVAVLVENENEVVLRSVPTWLVLQRYRNPLESPITCVDLGPPDADALLMTGHANGHVAVHMLPSADGHTSLLATVTKLLTSLKVVDTVKQASHLARSTMDNAKAATTTAGVIAEEAMGEAKSIVRGLMTYWN